MPLRQSTIKFAFSPSASNPTMPPRTSSRASRDVCKLTPNAGANADSRTIDITNIQQLPTPSESATDVSSQGSQNGETKQIPKSRSKRVSNVRKSRFVEDTMNPADLTAEEKNRSLSGETLTAENKKEPNQVQDGVKALNLPWDMSDVFEKSNNPVAVENTDRAMSEAGSVITVRESTEPEEMEEEDEMERAKQNAARKAKMEENARKWAERNKAAEESATRRSKRASLLGKAGDMLSGLTGSVLGKRSREVVDKGKDRLSELRSSVRPQSASSHDDGFALKKSRQSEDNSISEEISVQKVLTNRREKKWLSHGLYAGQLRTFDARLNENKNKRKSIQDTEPQKENTVIPLPMFAGERLLKQGRDFKLPFDIFCPLPSGQPKPDEWRKTNKNVFVGDAAQEWRTSKFVEHSTCLCRPETGCDHNCMNRYMYYECDEKNCNLSSEQCGNRAFEGLKTRVKIGGKYNVGVEVIKTVDRGHGVRSNRSFEPNQIIVEYTGEIITQEECEHRMHTMYKDNECYYLMLFDQNMIIDATRGSIARFVNHSCEPNCRMEKWTVGGKPRMALFAGDWGVMTGEELTYDYNFDPYSQKNVQVCRCGASNCRGILGPKPKEVKQKSPDTETNTKKSEGRLAGAKRKFAEVLEESTTRLNKKRKSELKPAAKLVKAPKSKQAKTVSPKKVIIVKKTTVRRVSMPKTATKPLGRSDSKLKKIISSAKGRADTAKSSRIISGSSATEALIPKDNTSPKKGKGLSRSTSLKEKATSLRNNVVRSVRSRSKSMNALVTEA